MLNSSTRKDMVLLQKLPVLATFETTVVVIVILIIVTSSLVIKNIYDKMNRTRADSMFMLLSISDIGVGGLSMPALGIRVPFFYRMKEYYKHGSRAPLIISDFCIDFPYTFSNILTAIIAVDRLFIIVWDNCYQQIITEKKLKIIAAFLLLFSIGYLCLDTYYGLPERCCDTKLLLLNGFVGILTASLILIILAYIYILFTVRKSSKRIGLYSKHNNTKRDKKLFKVIFYILLCQVTCVIPYLILLSLYISQVSLGLRYNDIGPWLVILRNCQCFCNGFILLYNQKRNTKKSQTIPVENLNENKYCKGISS